MNKIEFFSFKSERFGEVRAVEVDGIVYFVGIDVAAALGYERPEEAVSRHCRNVRKCWIPEDRDVALDAHIIPVHDVFPLMAHSDCPHAVDLFEWWIFEEVLPSIYSHNRGFAGMTEEELAKYELETGSIVLFDSENTRGISFQKSGGKLVMQIDGLDDAIVLSSEQIDVLELYLGNVLPKPEPLTPANS